jgi:hypothetical protein
VVDSPDRKSVRITRRERDAGERVPIARKAWRDIVHADPELKPDGEDSVRWSGLAADEFCLLVWRDGEIEALDPPPTLVKKMAELAVGFDAVAQGDHGEIYDAKGGSTAALPEAALARAKEIAEKKRRRGPLWRDPLSWQIIAWAFAGLVVLLAAFIMLMVTRRFG